MRISQLLMLTFLIGFLGCATPSKQEENKVNKKDAQPFQRIFDIMDRR